MAQRKPEDRKFVHGSPSAQREQNRVAAGVVSRSCLEGRKPCCLLQVHTGHWQLIEAGTGSCRAQGGAGLTVRIVPPYLLGTSSACCIMQSANVFALLKSEGEADSIDESECKVRLER